MADVIDDIQEADETRPAKRVRLEAPLDTTAEVEEEMIDDEDLYGTDADGDAANGPTVVAEPNTKPAVSEDVAHELPNTVNMSEAGVQAENNGSATPQVDGEDTMDTEDLYAGAQGETAEGLPAEAVDHGEDEFVAPPMHVEGEDGVETAMMEETSRVEAEPPAESQNLANGARVASTTAIDQNKGTAPRQAVKPGVVGDGEEHIAPPKTQPATSAQSEEPRKDDAADEDDFYGNLESALKASGDDETANSGTNTSGTANKPQDDPEFLQAAAAQKSNASAEWQFDSSDAESSSSDSSDSSDSDSDSESGSEGGYEMLDPATAAKILMSGDGEDGDVKEKGDGPKGPRTANEVNDDIASKPDVKITEDMKITPLGTIDRIVENMALIKGATPGEYQVLESGSVLCNAAREVIGAVTETFGRVQEPMYSIAFGSAKEIEDMGLQFGTEVYYVDSHSRFVFTQPLKGMKGTDASNIHDEEVPEDEQEFSDDEKEAEYKRLKKQAKRGGRGGLTRTEFNSDRSAMRTFGAPGHDSGHTFVGGGASDAPQTSYGGGMSYDDDDASDDFYQPLKRPDNLSELMAGKPPPPPSQRGGFERGRGRGRGRGDRGRGDRGRGRGGFNQRGQHGNAGGGQRGGHDQANGHRGSAQTFPDRHNNNNGPKSRGRGPHNLPAKPHGHQSPTSPQSSPQQQYQQYPPFPHAQPQQPPAPTSPHKSYQFNGYTFQYGNPPPTSPTQYQQAPQQPQQCYSNYQSYQHQRQMPPQQQQSPGAQFPAGAYVNPAFWSGGQQQHQPAHQYGGWNGQAPQQQYAPPPQAPGQGQQGDLANILRALGGQGQGQR